MDSVVFEFINNVLVPFWGCNILSETVSSLKICLRIYQKEMKFKELFLGLIIYCPLFYDVHESDSKSVNLFDSVVYRWETKYLLLWKIYFLCRHNWVNQ